MLESPSQTLFFFLKPALVLTLCNMLSIMIGSLADAMIGNLADAGGTL